MPKFEKKKMVRGAKIRVLIVDDSVVIRRLVKHALEQDPRIEVVGAAANGVIALRMIATAKPDVVTLDIEMPEMNGLQTLREIRKLYADLVVIMFSTISERGAAVTIEALSCGANDYVTKVANVGSLEQSMARLREELVPKLKQFFTFADDSPNIARSFSRTPDSPIRLAGQPAGMRRFPCRAVVIGVSTGGPNALAEIVPMFPEKFALPVLVVQHMPPVFTRLLAERLQNLTKLQVKEAVHGMPIEKGSIYIAPGNYHMRATKQNACDVLVLDQAEPENSCRPAVDVMFRSAADLYGGAVIAVILTGMGQDGLRGAERLHAEGAYVIAQDESSSVVWGMPGAVARAGLANTVVNLHAVVPEIVRHVP